MSCQYWRISNTLGGLLQNTFASFDLPEPSVSTYQNYKETRPKSDGNLAVLGRPQYSLLFDVLTSEQGWLVRKLVSDALAGGGQLYMTVPRADGTKPGWDWVDLRGVPHRPLFAGAGSYAGRSGNVYYENYQLFLEAVVIVNDPSSYAVL